MMRGSVTIVNHSFCDASFISHIYTLKFIHDRSWGDKKASCMGQGTRRAVYILPYKAAIRNSFVSTFQDRRLIRYENYTQLTEASASDSYRFEASAVCFHPGRAPQAI